VQFIPTQALFGHGSALVQRPFSQVRRLVPFTHSAPPIGQMAQKSLVPLLMQPFVQFSSSTHCPLAQTCRTAPEQFVWLELQTAHCALGVVPTQPRSQVVPVVA
jgi:hypothetical protein